MPYFLFSYFLRVFPVSYGQEISFRDTIAAYNKKRVSINETGMKVLGAWGIGKNIADGGIGYFMAKQDEWKYFHGKMNALWGWQIQALHLR